MYCKGYLYTQKMADFNQVNIGGVDLKIPEKGFASEETLGRLVKALDPSRKTPKADPVEKQTQDTKKKYINILGKSIAVTSALTKAFDGLGSVLRGTAGVSKAIMDLNGSFSSLGGMIDYGVRMLEDSFVAKIPIVGGFITDAAYATAEMTKLQLEFMDQQRGAYSAFSQAGFAASVNLDKFQNSVFDANLNLQQFTGIMAENTQGLRLAFGSVEGVQKNFVQSLSEMTSPKSPFGMSLRLLGLGSEEIAGEFANFVETQRRSRNLQILDEGELRDAVQERAKNERILAEFTGMTVQEQRQEQMALMGDMAYQAALLQKVPAEFRDEMTQLTAAFSQYGLGDMAKQILGFNQVLSPETALIQAAVPELSGAIQDAQAAIMRGEEPAVAMAPVLDLIKGNIDSLLPLLELGLIPGAEQFTTSIGQMVAQSLENETQLENLNKLMGTNYATTTEAMEAFNEKYDMALEDAALLAKKFEESGLSFDEFAAQQGLSNAVDASVLKLAAQNAGIEEAQTEMQKAVHTLTTNFRGVADVALGLQTAFADLLKEMGYEIDDQGTVINKKSMTMTLGEKMFDANPDLPGIQLFNFKRQGLATGGPAMGGGLYMVGERGPELLAMDEGSSGYVYNNSDTRKLMSMATPRYNGGPVGDNMMATMAFLDGEGLQGTRKYEDRFEIGYTETIPLIAEMMSKEYAKQMEKYIASGKKLDINDGNYEEVFDNMVFKGNGGAVVGELRNINKNLKNILGKAYSGNGYY